MLLSSLSTRSFGLAVLQAPRSDSGAICHLIDLVLGFELRGADLNLTQKMNHPNGRACTKFDFSTLKNMKEEAVSCHLKNVLLYKLITTATLDVCS